MIVGTVKRNGETIVAAREFHDPSLSLEMVLKKLELYIVNEQLNVAGECVAYATFSRL